jgi:hypothetical protein
LSDGAFAFGSLFFFQLYVSSVALALASAQKKKE